MRTVFIDANVVIDWLVAKAIKHSVCTKAVELSLTKSRDTFISPTTLAITSYFLYKNYKSEKKAKAIAQQVFAPFRFTSENEEMIKAAFLSKFTDLEDAIQYQSAFHAKMDVIVTQNVHDFSSSDIAVISPEEFCRFYSTAAH